MILALVAAGIIVGQLIRGDEDAGTAGEGGGAGRG
jgi:hypothetical protein